jgi:hypothetical protein
MDTTTLFYVGLSMLSTQLVINVLHMFIGHVH